MKSLWERIKRLFNETFGEEGLFSSWQERHAFLIGISEVVAFWKPKWDMPEEYEAWLSNMNIDGSPLKPGNPLYEYHYYMFGRACGVLFWVFAILPSFCLVMQAVWR